MSLVQTPAAEAVAAVVGEGDGLVLVVEGDHGEDGTEDLLLGDAHAVVYAGEDGRLDEPASVVRGLAAEGEPGAFALSDVDVVEDLGVLGRSGDGSDLGCLVHGVTHPGGAREVDQAAHDLVVHALLHQEPGAA